MQKPRRDVEVVLVGEGVGVEVEVEGEDQDRHPLQQHESTISWIAFFDEDASRKKLKFGIIYARHLGPRNTRKPVVTPVAVD
jgi:hypothetical protein